MKKKILIASVAVNMIAVAFVFYSFTSKAKSVNDGGGYIIMHVGAQISVSDGNSILSQDEQLKPMGMATGKWAEIMRENNQTITKKMNDLKSQGYELVSSNGGDNYTNYIFVKK